MPKWLVIARNEYRTTTSSIRTIRPYFPYLIIGLLAVFVVFIAPAFVSPFIGDFLALILSQAAVPLVQIILFVFFFFLMLFPISLALREMQTGQLEILRAAPIKPSDILLGKFLGATPFYAILITVVVGFFTAFLSPLGLGIVQIAIIIMTFIVTFLSALWIGTVIAAILRTKLGKTARGKDIGKAPSLIIVLPVIAVMYAIMGGGLLEALVDPRTGGMVKAALGLLPSSWGAEVFVGFASNPGNIAAVWFETLARFGGLIIFFVAALWLGAKAVGRAYSLDFTTFTASRAKPDGAFYKTVKNLGGGRSFGTLLVSIFKDYGRRFENLSKIAYIVGLLVLVGVFFGDYKEPTWVVFMGIFSLPILAAFVVGEVTVRGKENLFMYRKAPLGEGRLIKGRLLQGWIVVIPIVAVYATISLILIPQVTFISLLTYAGLLVLIAAAYVALALGLFILMPVFTEKPAGLMGNAMILTMVSVGLFMVSIIVFDLPLLYLPLIWLLGIVFLYLGKRNLSRIE
ncbi:hypothetical protein ES703_110374 [subsurface metagenome]